MSDGNRFSVFSVLPFLPNEISNEISSTKNLIHQETQRGDFIVINGNEYHAVFTKELFQQREARIHQAKPFVVAGKVFGFPANGFAQPVADERAVDVDVVNPAF